jgi:predicted ester cyclase
VARVTQSGTQRGDFLGIPATGRHATWTLIGIWRIECGRIAEDRVDSDGLAFFEGIGVLEWPPVNGVVASPTAE